MKLKLVDKETCTMSLCPSHLIKKLQAGMHAWSSLQLKFQALLHQLGQFLGIIVCMYLYAANVDSHPLQVATLVHASPYIQYPWKLSSNCMAPTILFQNSFHDNSLTKFLSLFETSTARTAFLFSTLVPYYLTIHWYTHDLIPRHWSLTLSLTCRKRWRF